jgi:type IV pilus biogenesis protein CpaD/CtpE
MHRWKSSASLMAALLLTFGATGCATRTPAEPDFCATARPIYISKTDSISDATARQVLTHNLTGARLCGWTPKEKAK